MGHASDQDIQNYLQHCSSEVVYDLTQILGDRLGFNGMKNRFASLEAVPIDHDERAALVGEIVREIGYFGSNNIAYWVRWATGGAKAVGYHEILFDVTKSLNRQLKKKFKIPRVASVSDRERMICEQLLGIAFQGKSEDEIARMLTEADLDSEATKAAAIKAAEQGGTGGLILALVKLLGKKTVTTFLSAVVMKIIATRIGKEAAEKIVFAVLKKVPQKTVSAFMAFVGVALLAKDVLDLAGPGTRVTIPAIALIASARTSEALAS